MNRQVIDRILRQYNVAPQRILPVQKGYRNESHGVIATDGKQYNLILYKQEPGILNKIALANRASDFLASRGLPCRAMQNPNIIQLSGPGYLQHGALYNYLPGLTIPWEAYTQTHIKLLGMTMGQMHGILAELKPDDFPSVIDQLQSSFSKMEGYFSNPGVVAALAGKTRTAVDADVFEHYASDLQAIGHIDEQVLHMDFVRGNILFEKDDLRVSGILDFEKVARGPIVFDVARTLAFLLVDCKYKPANKIYKYFLNSGYIKRGSGKIHDVALLEKLVDIFLTYDFYKFLLHNPYESLNQNEHFTRTRAILVQREVIAVA